MAPTSFKEKLQAHLQGPPYPGCIFIQATTTSDQAQALTQIRQVTATAKLATAALHPNLLGNRVIDVRNDIRQAFDQDQEEVGGSSIASAVSIYPEDNTTTPRVLIIPSAHLLRGTHSPLLWSQFLYPPSMYTVVLISSIPLDRWRTAEGVESLSGFRPILRMTFACPTNDVAAQLTPQLDSYDDDILPASFRSSFVTFVLAAFEAEISNSDVGELIFLSLAVWKGLRAVLSSHAATSQNPMVALRPLTHSALSLLHTRRMNVDEWIQHLVEHTEQKTAPHRSTPPSPLDPISTLLLLSAFLASHLPPKSDSRFFLRDEATLPNFTLRASSRRRRKKTTTNAAATQQQDDSTTNSPLLLGPKPFTYQRMMYVFQNLCVEFDVTLPSLQVDLLRRAREATDVAQPQPHAQPHMDIYNVALHRHLQKLIAQQRFITVVSPPFSIQEHNDGHTATSLPPPLPLRLEHLNQSTLRCNLLRHEVKDIVLTSASSTSSADDRKQWWARVEECGL